MLPLLGFAVWGQNAQTPRFAAKPSAIPGVVVEGPDDGAYADAIEANLGPERTAETNSWLPFAVIVTNNTSQGILAFAGRWILTDPRGGKTELVMTRALFQAPLSQVGPGQAVVFLPIRILAARNPGLGLPIGSADYQPDELHRFQSAQKIRFTLDGVVFTSGQFVGPDFVREYGQLRAESTAGYQLATALIARRDAGTPLPDILRWLQETAATRPGGPFGTRNWDAAVTSREAASYLRRYQSGGEEVMYRLAQERLSLPHLTVYR
ncbi:MAG: hypothetical protein JST11_07975 [Acidobacteria bacterium]|nr:hypothetical protein [Acidobacteriota bacterium]